jgi:hypothetical protein
LRLCSFERIKKNSFAAADEKKEINRAKQERRKGLLSIPLCGLASWRAKKVNLPLRRTLTLFHAPPWWIGEKTRRFFVSPRIYQRYFSFLDQRELFFTSDF